MTKLFTSVTAALALMYLSGCCGQKQNCYYPQPVGADCPPVAYSASTVTYEPGCPPVVNCPPPPPVVVDCPPVVECPPPKPVKVKKAKKPKSVKCYNRRNVRCYVPNPCSPCAPQYYPTVAYAGTATLLNNPEYVPAVGADCTAVAVVPAGRSEVAGNYVTVYQRGRKGRKVQTKQQKKRSTVAATTVAYAPQATMGPVYTVEPAPVSESYAITPLSPSAAPVEPVEFDEPEEIAEPVMEPVVEALPEPVIDEPSYAQYLSSEPARVMPAEPVQIVAPPVQAVTAPQTAPELVPGQIIEYPVAVQQPYAQPVVIQPIIQPMMQPAMPVQNPQMTAPVAVPPAGNAWVEGGMVSSAYCPPEICPPATTTNQALCAPGQNMSECFTLSENQLLNSPQIYTPNPMAPAGIIAPPPAAPAQFTHPTAQNNVQSKYAALPPPPDNARDNRRPEVSLPAPLSNDNIPMVPGASEIESMLDAMVPPPSLK